MNELEAYREQMSKIDRQIAQLFLERMQVSKKIGLYKKKQKLPIFQAEREKIVLETMKSFTNDTLEQNAIEILFQTIMDLSKEVQK